MQRFLVFFIYIDEDNTKHCYNEKNSVENIH